MKKIIYFYYFLFSCGLHSSFVLSMNQQDILQVHFDHGTITHIYPTPQTWPSFTRHLLKKQLEKEIDEDTLSSEVTITASGKNVALALHYAAENPTKVNKLILQKPKINISSGIDLFEYYRGNFPLSAINTSKLRGLPITVKDYTLSTSDHTKAIILLCRKTHANLTIPNSLSMWHGGISTGIQSDDINAELNAIFTQEKKEWWYNKILVTSISGFILYVLHLKGYLG